MARTAYTLRNAREATVVSSNGTTYTVNILWTGSGNTTANSMTLGKDSIKINYENPNAKDKNSYILTSNCTLSYLVTSAADQTFISSLSSTYEERDVWITIREGANVLWAGYVLLDLKDEQDISYPYEVSLTAIDGIAGLKDIPFIRETNLSTSAVPTFPYVPDDTFYNSGHNNLLDNAVGGTTTKYLAYLIAKTGMVLASDSAESSSNFLEDYPIQTAVNYYNEGHPAPADNIDPLGYTQLRIQQMYKEESEGYIGAPDCYTVLEYICKNFGMRCIYWQHTFHFVSLDEYNTDEDAAGTATDPINIPTRLYQHTGAVASPHTQDYLGTNTLSIYNLSLENATDPGEGLQKLSGAVYTGLPPIKTATGLFFGFTETTSNAYKGFPLMPTLNTTGVETMYNNWPRVGGANYSGTVDYGTIINAASGDGIYFKAHLSYKNTASTSLHIYNMFVLIAREGGQAGFFPCKVCRRSGTNASNYTYVWEDWTSGSFPFTIDTDYSAKYAFRGNWAPTSPSINQSTGIKVYDTANDNYCTSNSGNTAGLFPTDAAFTGAWEFAPMSLTCWDSNSPFPLYGFNGGISTINLGSVRNHGATIKQSGTTTYSGALAGNYQKMTDYQWAHDQMLENGTPKGELRSVNSPDIVSTTSIEVSVENENSFVYDAGDYFWGEGGTIQVSDDGSTYVAAGEGKWTNPTYAWHAGTSQFNYTVGSYDKRLVTLILQDIIYNQSVPLKQLNGTTALSETNKFYTGTSILKYMNPIGKLKDSDNKEYIFSRGTFSLLSDECESTLNEVDYEVPSQTVNFGFLVLIEELTVI